MSEHESLTTEIKAVVTRLQPHEVEALAAHLERVGFRMALDVSKLERFGDPSGGYRAEKLIDALLTTRKELKEARERLDGHEADDFVRVSDLSTLTARISELEGALNQIASTEELQSDFKNWERARKIAREALHK